MHKLLFLVVFLFIGSTIQAQEEITYSEVVPIENASQQDLLIKAKYGFIESGSNAKFDIETGQLLVSSKIRFSPNGIGPNTQAEGHINYTLQIDMEEGQYTYKFSDFTHQSIFDEGTHFGLITKNGIFTTTEKPKLLTQKRVAAYHKQSLELIEKEVEEQIRFLKTRMSKQVEELVISIPDGFVYSDFIPVADRSPEKMIEECRLWFAKKYVGSKDAILLEEKELGELYGIGRFSYKSGRSVGAVMDGTISYEVRIQAQEDGFKYTILNFAHRATHDGSIGKIKGEDFGLLTKKELCASSSTYTKKVEAKTCADFHAKIAEEGEAIAMSLKEIFTKTAKELAPEKKQEGQLLFSEIVSVDSRSKDELYLAANIWVHKMFNVSHQTFDVSDKEAGVLHGRFYVDYNPPLIKGGGMISAGIIWFDMTIQTQDGKYKYVMSDFEHVANPDLELPFSYGPISDEDVCFQVTGPMGAKRKKKLCGYVNKTIDSTQTELLGELEKAMRKAL